MQMHVLRKASAASPIYTVDALGKEASPVARVSLTVSAVEVVTIVDDAIQIVSITSCY